MPPLIVGAGPAGCAAALALAQRGIRATIVERDTAVRDAICGGFMSWRTLDALARIGIAVDGHPVTRVAVFVGGRKVDAPLPGRAIGLSRRALDRAMQAAVERHGVTIERGVEVRALCQGGVRVADGTTRTAPVIFLASGKHDVRGLARPRDAADATLGLRLRIGAHPSLSRLVGDAIELHLADRAYVGIELQEDGSANLCLAVRKSRLAEAEGNPRLLLRQLAYRTPLADRLAFAGDASIDAIAAVPYGWRATTTMPGLYRLGDQAAVIPSIAGEGIGIAVASGVAAAHAYADGCDAPSFQRAFARQTRRPVATARLLWHAAENVRLAALAVPMLRVLPGLAQFAARVTRIDDLMPTRRIAI